MRSTSSFRDFVLFLIFVAVSASFWVILALNDSAQDSFSVKISIVNCPDSVTFISDVPEKFYVTVRDKGTTLWRNHYRRPTISVNFEEYASKGVLRYSKNDIVTSLKHVFGSSSQILSVSIDSIHLDYTLSRGKRVPVVIRESLMAASGSVIEGALRARPSNVLVYGDQSVIDTIHKVVTELITLKELTETTEVDVNIQKIKSARIMPSVISVTIPVEPLVRKEALITITPQNVPRGESMLIFPSKVPVEYYVAMSRLGDDDDPNIELLVDYNSIHKSKSDKVLVTVSRYPERLQNLSLKTDSVEFTIVKN